MHDTTVCSAFGNHASLGSAITRCCHCIIASSTTGGPIGMLQQLMGERTSSSSNADRVNARTTYTVQWRPPLSPANFSMVMLDARARLRNWGRERPRGATHVDVIPGPTGPTPIQSRPRNTRPEERMLSHARVVSKQAKPYCKRGMGKSQDQLHPHRTHTRAPRRTRKSHKRKTRKPQTRRVRFSGDPVDRNTDSTAQSAN